MGRKMYSSINEICNEFNIKYSDDIDRILRELTEIQSKLHPDNYPNTDKINTEKYFRVSEAKNYIRKNYKQKHNLIEVSDLEELIKTANNNSLSLILKEKERSLESTYETKVKQIKSSYIPKKIAVGTILAICSAIWAFPSVLEQNPLIRNSILLDNTSFYSILTILWILILLISLLFLFKILKRETYFKNILLEFKNTKFQYEVFSAFAKKLIEKQSSQNITFFKSELEEFILEQVLNKHKKPYTKQLKYKLPNNIYSYIDELLPKLSEIIISRALSQKIIRKSESISWEDKYIIVAKDCF